MKSLLSIILLLHFTAAMGQPVLTDHERDSIAGVVCNMETADQDVRDRWHKAKAANDTGEMKVIAAEWGEIDSVNFATLHKIIITIGYPCKQLLGQNFGGRCMPNAILIHWMKNHPAWFCDRALIPVFKKELEAGHLPLPIMDFCFFSYVSYMKADVNLLPLINAARTAYGLLPYTRKQYTQQEYIEPLMRDNNEDRRKHKMRIKGQVPVRNTEHG